MITITFTAPPELRKKAWRCHVSGQALFLQFPTKRRASIYLADSGRRATAWLMEINELARLVMHTGQGYASSMALDGLMAWAELKVRYDQRYIAIARHRKATTPGEMLPKIEAIAAIVRGMVDHVTPLATMADSVQLRIIRIRAQQITQEIADWTTAA